MVNGVVPFLIYRERDKMNMVCLLGDSAGSKDQESHRGERGGGEVAGSKNQTGGWSDG